MDHCCSVAHLFTQQGVQQLLMVSHYKAFIFSHNKAFIVAQSFPHFELAPSAMIVFIVFTLLGPHGGMADEPGLALRRVAESIAHYAPLTRVAPEVSVDLVLNPHVGRQAPVWQLVNRFSGSSTSSLSPSSEGTSAHLKGLAMCLS